MKRSMRAVLLMFLLSTVAFAADKYVATDYGFSIVPPGNVSIVPGSGPTTFMSLPEDGSFVGAVSTLVIDEALEDDQAYIALDAAADLFGKIGVIEKSKHTTLQGYPTVKAIFNGESSGGRKFRGLVMFIYVKKTKRVYYVAAETKFDHPNLEGCVDFMRSFEIL